MAMAFICESSLAAQSSGYLITFVPSLKKRASLGLGVFPDISLADARVEAQKFKGLLAKEIDPKKYRIEQAWKDEKAHTNTFEHVAEKWLKLKESKVSNSYYKKISSRLELHVGQVEQRP